MNEQKISVIVPVYRVEQYLERCVRSIMAQEYQNLEIILVDDGSPDRCGEMCDRLSAEDSRIRVLHTENHGLGGARNRGIDAATGTLLGFVDSDDWIEADMYSSLYANMTDNGADIAVTAFRRDNGHSSKCKVEPRDLIVANTYEAMELLIDDRYMGNHACTKLFRANLFQDIRFPEGRLYEDIAIFYRILARAAKVTISTEPKYHYVIRKESIVAGRRSVQRNLDYITAVQQMLTYMIEHGHPRAADYFVRRTIHSVKRLITSGADRNLLLRIITTMEPYRNIPAGRIGVANVWRRWMMIEHTEAYITHYKLKWAITHLKWPPSNK